MNKKKLNIGIYTVLLILILGNYQNLFAQKSPEKQKKEVKHYIEKGIDAYNSAEYEKAEKAFRKALGHDPLNDIASYNLGLTLTEEEKKLEAARYFSKAGKMSESAEIKDKSYFNEGNIWLQKKKYEKAVEAYKNALRNNPGDEEARYNLAIALDKLKKQQKKNKQNKKNKKDNKKDNKKNQDQKNKDRDKKDQKQKNKDQKNKNNKENKKDKNKDNKQNKKDQNKKDQNKKNDQNQKNKKQDQQNKKDKKDSKDGDKKKESGKDKKEKKENKNKPGDKNKQPSKPGEQKQQAGKPGEQKSKLSPQQVKQLLIGLKNKEKKTQQKIQAKVIKAKSQKKKTDKDW